MTVSLEKKLAEVTVAKKRYRFLFIMAFVALIVLLGIKWIFPNWNKEEFVF